MTSGLIGTGRAGPGTSFTEAGNCRSLPTGETTSTLNR